MRHNSGWSEVCAGQPVMVPSVGHARPPRPAGEPEEAPLGASSLFWQKREHSLRSQGPVQEAQPHPPRRQGEGVGPAVPTKFGQKGCRRRFVG